MVNGVRTARKDGASLAREIDRLEAHCCAHNSQDDLGLGS